MKGKWVCSLCGTVASSKCVGQRSVFIETPDGLSDVAHMLIKATTLVQHKENDEKKIECLIETHNIKTLANIIMEIAKCPAVLNELLCNHCWQLDGNDCELHCGYHQKYLGTNARAESCESHVSPLKRPLPSVEDVAHDFESYRDLYKRAKTQIVESHKKKHAIRAIKLLFDEHVSGIAWNESAVKIDRYDSEYKSYFYSYDDSGVVIQYLERITWCHDDYDTVVDASVVINGITVYEEVKDNVLINKKN
jgi:hypothetical protein